MIRIAAALDTRKIVPANRHGYGEGFQILHIMSSLLCMAFDTRGIWDIKLGKDDQLHHNPDSLLQSDPLVPSRECISRVHLKLFISLVPVKAQFVVLRNILLLRPLRHVDQ